MLWSSDDFISVRSVSWFSCGSPAAECKDHGHLPACHMVDAIIACPPAHAAWRGIGSEGPALSRGKRVKWALFLDMDAADADALFFIEVPLPEKKEPMATPSLFSQSVLAADRRSILHSHYS